ncbi:sodium-dependent transporter [Paenibacillus validus]|uniref:sodium-dependent transporter n=1 Tax=Paenibacillus validus TaxID=44253 RepID=UPI000FD9335D|nr:sodium-dependent transporter [Paenibacillus validus]MED4604203.1 sodium-dependent transporter [Paenibacillus validus]MED4609583.1 sodium-dependent transporter [Paenibacillus validus]
MKKSKVSPSLDNQPASSDRFSSSGFILTAIGSAVGLGNMWKFPYITGQYGGAAFFLLFIVCLLLVGLPVLIAEMTIGRSGRGNASSSFFLLSKSRTWGAFGFVSVFASFMIMTFYAVVAGWTMHYAALSFTDSLYADNMYKERFVSFTSGYVPLFWQAVVMIITGWVVGKGISGGIEKFNKVLIPGLVILLLGLMIRSLTLPNAMAGVEFFLKPDFSKLSAESALVALGHAFFSLSLGMGIMITYGAYTHRSQSLKGATLAIGAGDLIYAFIAGLIIFPTSFAFGIEPSQGPGLVFMALPAAFAAMPFGQLFGGLFFVLLAIAALTSAVSILEVPVAYAMGKWNWSRIKATTLVSAACFVLGVPSALSAGAILGGFTIAGKPIMDLIEYVASNVLLPFGGLVVTLFAGYVWTKSAKEAGLDGFGHKLLMFMLRYVSPLLTLLVLLYTAGLFDRFFNK